MPCFLCLIGGTTSLDMSWEGYKAKQQAGKGQRERDRGHGDRETAKQDAESPREEAGRERRRERQIHGCQKATEPETQRSKERRATTMEELGCR